MLERDRDSSSFNVVFDHIKANKEVRDRGGYNSIPFGIPSLDRHVPGIMPGVQYEVTASSGIGKTQLTKFLFVSQPYKFIKANPQTGLKLKIFWYAMEESILEFMLTLICARLKEEYGLVVQPLEMTSMGEYHLRPEILDKIAECREYFEELEKSIEVIDYISNPFGIYKHARAYARANGKHYYKGNQVDPEGSIFDLYVANDPKEIRIGVTDHLSLLQTEATTDTNTLQGAMSKFSSEYCRKMLTKHLRYAWVNIHQQEAAKEKLQFTNSGQNIEQKLKPSLDGLGDCKLTGRDALVVLGLFSPERYQINKYLGYDITKLQDNFRSLEILKNRFGTPNLECGLYFNGATNTFRQLPKADSEEMKQVYEGIRNGTYS